MEAMVNLSARFWQFVSRLFATMDRLAYGKAPAWSECWEVHKKTLGYGLFFNGREVWSEIHDDFLASRWFDSVEEAAAMIPQAKADIEAGRAQKEVK